MLLIFLILLSLVITFLDPNVINKLNLVNISLNCIIIVLVINHTIRKDKKS